MTARHAKHMQRALLLARTNLGQTWPNPAVGAVIVKDGKTIGEGCTQRGGRPHAETEALAQAGNEARGATMYVTLEPCAHHGKTPPCTEAIIKAGIKQVVVACGDPAPHVAGKGIAQLKAAGIKIVEGICEQEAREINRGFFSVIEKKRPYVAIKIAVSADGKIAARAGTRTQITGEAAQRYAQKLRGEFDAIATGIGTVLIDNPLLTVRLAGMEHKSPVRVILDRKHRLPPESNIAKTMNTVPTWTLDLPDIESVLSHLAEKGITRLLVEAGQTLNTAFLKSGAVDRAYVLESPVTIGNQGLSAVEGHLGEMLAGWKKVEHSALPPDILDVFDHV